MSQAATQPVALVTGASRGIGRGIAEALGAAGWAVAVNYNRSREAAEVVAANIERAGGRAVCLAADVGDLTAHEPLIAAVEQQLGPLDLLVSSAGIGTQVRGDLLEATPASFDQVLGTNLRGPFFLVQQAARAMIGRQSRPTRPAAIVIIGSISAYTASITRGDYCISKAGLAMVTALYASRLASEGINVYEIRPGIIATDMTGGVKDKYDRLIADGLTPIARWGEPDDIAQAVLAVAEGRLRFSTGQVIDVDGGFHLRRL